jgi:hypothetical protein
MSPILECRLRPAIADVARVFDVFGMADRAVKAALDHFGKADDGVERRAQFVAHMGDEFGFGALRLDRARSALASRTSSRASRPRRAQRADRFGGLGAALELAHEHRRQPAPTSAGPRITNR